MTSKIADNRNSKAQILQSSFYGALRGTVVEMFVYPLQVVKIRQQCLDTPQKSLKVATMIFQEGGCRAFYKGLFPEILKIGLKQIWCWPIITEMPHLLSLYGFKDTSQQILTGLSIATVDAAVTSPLEKAKVFSALTGRSSLCLESVYKEGWKGFTTYWAKRSVGMITFLTAQEYLRRRSRKDTESLDLFELTKIGVQVALIVSFVSAPFDMANTLKQAQNRRVLSLFSQAGFLKLFRGCPLNTLSSVIQSVASVVLIEKLRKDSPKRFLNQ